MQNTFIFMPASYSAMQALDVRLIAIATIALKVSLIPFEIDPASHGPLIKVKSRGKKFNEQDYHSIALAFAEAALQLGGLLIRWGGSCEENSDVTIFEIVDSDRVKNWDE